MLPSLKNIKLLCLSFCLLCSIFSCKDKEEPYLTLSLSEIKFKQPEAQQNIDIQTNVTWESNINPSSASSWLTLNPTRGNGQSGTLTLSISSNATPNDRYAEVIFQSSAGIQTLRINQDKKEILNIVSENERYIWQPGGKMPIDIENNIEYGITIAPEAQSWISLIDTKSLSLEKIYFEIKENISETERYGEIYIQQKDPLSKEPALIDTLKITQENLFLETDKDTLQFGALTQTKWAIITSSHQILKNNEFQVNYSYSQPKESEDWCIIEKNKNNLCISVTENKTGEKRETDITVTASVLSRKIHIIQTKASDEKYYDDGEYIQLQAASLGKGVNIVIMGDGFTKNDLNQEGNYEIAMRKAYDYFFSIEPFHSYKQYFNVYMIAAESEEEGISGESATRPVVKTKFNSTFGEGTHIQTDLDLCQQYVQSIPDLVNITQLLSIIVLNSHKYAGTTSLFSNGFTVALCPMSKEASPNDFEGLVHHEAGGHGFGLLLDEYVYYNEQIPESEKNEVKKWQSFPAGFYPNADFSGNINQTRWKDFAGKEKYSQVGTYEGADTYKYGIWRPEENSCMNNNIPYFNAPSRWAIVKRIMNLAGNDTFTFDDFVNADHVTAPTTTKNAGIQKDMPPLGKPQRIIL